MKTSLYFMILLFLQMMKPALASSNPEEILEQWLLNHFSIKSLVAQNKIELKQCLSRDFRIYYDTPGLDLFNQQQSLFFQASDLKARNTIALKKNDNI